MTEDTRRRIREALEGEYGRATDNAARARFAFQGMDARALGMMHGQSGKTRGELLASYEREEAAALAALKDFDPAWTPRRAFGR